MPTATDTNGAAPASEARAAVRPSPLKLVRPVEIELDRPRTLVMDFEAMARFEEETGISAWSRDAWNQIRYVPVLVWAALLHEDPDLTVAEVKSWKEIFHIANMAYLSDRLGELWGASMPEPDAADDAAVSEGDRDADPNPRRRAG